MRFKRFKRFMRLWVHKGHLNPVNLEPLNHLNLTEP
jgi:hypothetical protein